MKKLNFLLCFIFILTYGYELKAQNDKPNGPYEVTTATTVTKMPSLASRSQLIPSTEKTGEVQDGRASKNKIIPGKGTNQPDALAQSPHRLEGAVRGRAAELVFETAQSSSQPTDPSGAVGPDHYFAVFNTGFRIFDKLGNPLTAQLGTGNIFPASGCCDLTVSYDNLADRWVLSFLGNGVQVAVSTGPDPLTTEWVVYNFPSIADYNKLSVWRDGYYITQNGGGGRVHVLERDVALEGDTNAQMASFLLPGLQTSGFNSAQVFNIADDNHPLSGPAPIVYLQDDAWAGVSNDHIKLWEITLDWDNVSNSSVSEPQEISTTPFISVFDGGSFANLTQPGGQDIDALQATIMNQAQFRKLPTYNSAVFNFVVDTDDTAGELAGIRWVEMRQATDGGAWTLFQEGTYTAPDGKHAWHGSMSIDIQGNIGLGYTAMAGPTTPTDGSVDLVLSSYYTGRFVADAGGVMSVEETLIAKGSGNIPGSERYGDYGKMDVDPLNNRKFWFLNEYVGPNGRANVLGVFQLAPVLANDIGVISIDAPTGGVTLENDEDVVITIFNYGEMDASNFDVTYQIDSGAIVTDTFTGTIASMESAQFTFAQGGDFSAPGATFTITSSTSLSNDDDNSNDTETTQVASLAAVDLGVVAITSPSTGNQSTATEVITIVIENFGGKPQSGFDVSYSIDGGTLVTENVANAVNPGETLEYSFTQTADLEELTDYELFATTAAPDDADNSNDSITIIFSNLSCTTQVNDNAMAVGPNANAVTESVITYDENIIINDVNVTLDIEHTFDADLDIFLIAPDGTSVELLTDVGGAGDNFTNLTLDDEADDPLTAGVAPFTGTFQPEGSLSDFDGLSTLGDWTLKITDDANVDGGQLLSWTLQLCSDGTLDVQEDLIEGTDLIIVNRGGNQFDINLDTQEITDDLNLRVFNMLGQKLLDTKVYYEGGSYQYELDMSYVAKGVYIIQLGNSSASKTKRLVVR